MVGEVEEDFRVLVTLEDGFFSITLSEHDIVEVENTCAEALVINLASIINIFAGGSLLGRLVEELSLNGILEIVRNIIVVDVYDLVFGDPILL